MMEMRCHLMTRWSKLGKVMRRKIEQKGRRGKEGRKEEDADARDEGLQPGGTEILWTRGLKERQRDIGNSMSFSRKENRVLKWEDVVTIKCNPLS